MVEISQRKGKTEAEARVLGCKVFTFGSYRLGVHGQGEGKAWRVGGRGVCMRYSVAAIATFESCFFVLDQVLI